MSDCLVTKLKEAVSDSSLYRLGEADIQFRVTTAQQYGFGFRLAQATTILTSSPVNVLDASFAVEKSSVISATLSAGRHYVQPVSLNTDVKLSIANKYTSIDQLGRTSLWAENVKLLGSCTYLQKLTELYLVGGDYLDIDLLANAPLLAVMFVTFANSLSGKLSSLSGRNFTRMVLYTTQSGENTLEGNISSLSFASAMSEFAMPYAANVKGAISTLGAYPLTQMNIGGTQIGGDLEDFCEAWYAHNVAQVNIVANQNVYLNNTPLSGNWSGWAKLSSGVLTVGKGSTTLATYDGNSWTYAQLT